MSKYNYESRRNYSINTVLLEKRLMYDATLRNGKLTIHSISDLKAYYDRQLLNIGCMVQEAVGVNWVAAKIFQIVLPVIKYYAVMDYGISTESYGSRENIMVGTGQDNSVLGAICRDTSCIIFSYLERKNLGVIINLESENT